MNASIFLQMAYENKSNWTLGENKPNSNPIKPNFRKAQMHINEDYENKTAFKLEQNKTKQSQGIKRIRSVFRGFILAFLAQAPHINITTHIVDPKTRICPQIRKKPEKPQVSVLTMGMGIFSSFFFTAGM